MHRRDLLKGVALSGLAGSLLAPTVSAVAQGQGKASIEAAQAPEIMSVIFRYFRTGKS